MKYGLLLFLGLFVLPAWAATGTMLKDEDLRSAPSSSAAKVTSLSKGSSVEVLARSGGWTQVRAGSRTGWVRILSVRTSISTGGAGDLAALASRREGSQVVAVAGLRGLNEEELKAARFDANELLLLDRYQAQRAEAESFARAAKLVARQLPYLPEPKTPSSSSSSGGGSGFNLMGSGQ